MRVAILAASVLWLAACGDRSHLTAGHGRSLRQATARQVVNPEAGKQPVASKGLDPQEAAVIAQSYRQRLAPKGEAAAPEQTLMVAPSAARVGRPGDYMPPASVPSDGR
jgi:hypothetical protein